MMSWLLVENHLRGMYNCPLNTYLNILKYTVSQLKQHDVSKYILLILYCNKVLTLAKLDISAYDNIE